MHFAKKNMDALSLEHSSIIWFSYKISQHGKPCKTETTQDHGNEVKYKTVHCRKINPKEKCQRRRINFGLL
jgi:hypothetical protein